VEMGIEPFLVASSVRCVVAQRLARVLCTGCKKPVTLEADVLAGSGLHVEHDITGYEAAGCPRCSGSGYRGRVGIYEIMPVSDEIRDLALHSASSDRIMDTARAEGMRTLREDAFEKVKAGVTAVDEILRVLGA
jgi:type IV pilus assembly protein PilB